MLNNLCLFSLALALLVVTFSPNPASTFPARLIESCSPIRPRNAVSTPDKSAEIGKDAEVRKIIGEVFGLPEDGPMTAEFNRRIDEFMVHFVNRNAAGGRAYFLPNYTPAMMQTILREAVPVWDVAISEPMWPVVLGRQYNGSLTYLHKVKDGRDIYFFANSSDRPVESTVALRGHMDLEIWDPMSGQIRPIEGTYSKSDQGQELTSVPLKLGAVRAVFLVTAR